MAARHAVGFNYRAASRSAVTRARQDAITVARFSRTGSSSSSKTASKQAKKHAENSDTEKLAPPDESNSRRNRLDSSSSSSTTVTHATNADKLHSRGRFTAPQAQPLAEQHDAAAAAAVVLVCESSSDSSLISSGTTKSGSNNRRGIKQNTSDAAGKQQASIDARCSDLPTHSRSNSEGRGRGGGRTSSSSRYVRSVAVGDSSIAQEVKVNSSNRSSRSGSGGGSVGSSSWTIKAAGQGVSSATKGAHPSSRPVTRRGGSQQQTVEHATNDLTDIRNKSFQQLQQLVKQYGAKASVSNLVAMFSRLKTVTWHSQQDKAAVLEQLWLCLEPKLSRCLPRQYAEVVLTASKLEVSPPGLYQKCVQAFAGKVQEADVRLLCNVIYAAGVAASWMPEVAEVKQLIQRQVIPAFLQQVQDIRVMQTVSNAVYGAALMGLSMPLQQLLQDKPKSMYSSAKPEELSITLYAAALCNNLQQQELDKVLPGLLCQLPQLLPQHVSNTLWAVATAGLKLQPQHVQLLMGMLLQQPPEPQALGMVLWSVAKMDMTVPQQQVDQLVEQLMAVLPACQPQTISNAVWGIATMGRKITAQQAEQLLVALLAAGGGSHQAIANTVWALAVMEVNVPTELLQQVYGILAELLPGAETQAVANALWAAASLPEPFLPHQLLTQDNLQLIAAKVPQMTAQELSNIGLACGILGVTDLRLLVPVFDAALQKLNAEGIALPADSSNSAGVQLQACCNLCWCCCVGEVLEVAGHCCSIAKYCADSWVWPQLATADKVQLYQLHLWLVDCHYGGNPTGVTIASITAAAASQQQQQQQAAASALGNSAASALGNSAASALGNLAAMASTPAATPVMGSGLLGIMSAQQLAECKASWQQLMQQHPSHAGPSTSLLQRSVFAAVCRLDSLLLQPTLESRTADHLFSVDIMSATPTGHLVAIEVDGPWHFTRPNYGLTGTTMYRNRALAARGYAVVAVPFYEWYQLQADKTAEEEYLQSKVNLALRQHNKCG